MSFALQEIAGSPQDTLHKPVLLGNGKSMICENGPALESAPKKDSQDRKIQEAVTSVFRPSLPPILEKRAQHFTWDEVTLKITNIFVEKDLQGALKQLEIKNFSDTEWGKIDEAGREALKRGEDENSAKHLAIAYIAMGRPDERLFKYAVAHLDNDHLDRLKEIRKIFAQILKKN